MNKDCELIVGPCTCGAWHAEDEVEEIRREIYVRDPETWDTRPAAVHSCGVCNCKLKRHE